MSGGVAYVPRSDHHWQNQHWQGDLDSRTLRVRDLVAYDWHGVTYTGHVVDIDKHVAINVIGEDPIIEIQLDKTGLLRAHLSELLTCSFRRLRATPTAGQTP